MPKGIIMTDGFFIASKKPADMKYIADTLADRDSYITGNLSYEGMLVYVKETGKTYQYNKNSQWEEFGFNIDKFQEQVYDGLDSDSSILALSARQGKVLNSNISNHINDNNKHITSEERNKWNAKADTTLATQTANGLMSATDKKNLDTLLNRMSDMEQQVNSMLEKLKTAVFIDDK